MNQLDLRWGELDASVIIDLFYLLKDPPESLQNHMETRIMESVETIPAKQLLTILGFVSQSGKANIPLMKVLCYHLSKNTEVFSFEQISKVIILCEVLLNENN